MITRPLDLAARLRPIPRGWDTLFYVNVCALAVFFFVFGSRFVLAPGLAVDFTLPQAGTAATATVRTDVVIAVPASGMAVVNGAVLDFAGLGVWLREQGGASGGSAAIGVSGDASVGTDGAERAGAVRRKRLLVQASASLPARDLAHIYALAADAGFEGVLIAAAESDPVAAGGGL